MATFPADGQTLTSAMLGKGATSWTPTITGVTAGLTVTSAVYWVTLGVAHFVVTMDCTGALTGSVLKLSLPVSIAPLQWAPLGDAILNPAGTRFWGKVVRYSTATEIAVEYLGAAGSPVDIAATVPATWSARSQAVALQFWAPLA